jgi:DNA-binding NarL/FixJ family response regulator
MTLTRTEEPAYGPRAPGREESRTQGLRQRQPKAIVVYIDSRALSRESIGRWLATRLPGFIIQTKPSNAEAAVFATANDRIALVLKHLGSARATLPEVAASLTELVNRLPKLPVAVIADAEEADVVTAALQCGVRGYIPTNRESAVVVEAVRLICAGDIYAPVSCLLGRPTKPQLGIEPAAARPAVACFSQRQREILACLRQGMANKHVAYALGLSEATVNVHVRNIMKKLHVTNRTQVVLMTMSMLDQSSYGKVQ